ncbi:MAG: ABC transporter ATP-binding protein [Deltaproteobacteria bacterium]|nr:ABC transporter ATP-binding protein [Deltaproteobacteria bacterium]
MSEVMIEVSGLSKSYRMGLFHHRRVQAVHNLDLEVRRGEIFGFVGPNGAGKTTVIKMLVGLLKPSSGQARILGRALPDREVQRKIGFCPEIANFYAYLTGLELMELHARLLGMPSARRKQRIHELVERVGMSSRADLPLRKFSKGMVQRIGLAQALLGEPELLVLDEPMSGLDPIGRRDVREIILEERRKGTTIFFSSHILSDVEQLCDRAGICIAGTLRATGRLGEIRQERLRAMEIVLTGWRPGLLDGELGGQISSLRQHDGTTTLLLLPDAPLDRVLHALLDGKASILEVKRHQQSLEDIFLQEARR